MSDKENIKEYSLHRQIALIVLGTMCALLLLQTAMLNFFLQRNDRKRQDYISSIVSATDASLTSIGQSIEGLGSYISTYPAFQELYIDGTGSADSYVEAYQAVRFMTIYTPVVRDIVVVDLNNRPMSFYQPKDYSVVDLVGSQYRLTDPTYTEKKFFFWADKDFFAYVLPIQSTYSSLAPRDKKATAILVCDKGYLQNLIKTEDEIALSFSDDAGQTIISRGEVAKSDAERTAFKQTRSLPFALTVRASGSTAYGQDVYRLLQWFFCLSVVGMLACMALVLVMLNRKIAVPIMALANNIAQSDRGELKRHVPRIAITEVNKMVDSFNQILDENGAITRRILATQDELYESELRKTEAELYALQSQINPHFLYNTLQCIRSLAIIDGSPAIADIALAMAELFRYSIRPGDTVQFAEELAIVKKYEMITSIRFRHRFIFRYEIDEALLSCRIIKMLVQPIIENAVQHGVARRETDGTVVVRGWLQGETVYLSVSDDGPEVDVQHLASINELLQRGEKEQAKCLGLYNINRRLVLRYGSAYGLSLVREENRTVVTITFPLVCD